MDLIDVNLDTTNLEKLLLSLPLKRRVRVINNSLKSVAAKTRKQVRAIVAGEFATRPTAPKPRKGGQRQWSRKSAPRKDVARGVLSLIYNRTRIGFKVYVSNTKPEGMHRNRQGKEKPVLFFNNRGTKLRKTSGNLKRRSANRGRVPGKDFMSKAGRAVDSQASKELVRTLMTQTEKIVAKYGAKLS